MAQFFIVNKSIRGKVTIDKEQLDFADKGWAQTDNEATYKAAQNLSSLGYSALTAKEMQEKYIEPAKKKAEATGEAPKKEEELNLTGTAPKKTAAKNLSADERKALTEKLNATKEAWDAEEDASKKAALAAEIEDLKAQLA